MRRSNTEFTEIITDIFTNCHSFWETRKVYSNTYPDESVPSVRTIVRALLSGPYVKNKTEEEFSIVKDELILQYIGESSYKVSISQIVLWFSVSKDHVQKLIHGEQEDESKDRTYDTDSDDSDASLNAASKYGGRCRERCSKLIPVLYNELERNKYPIVYTKRLDDMDALNDNIDTKEHIQEFMLRLHTESKPKFDGIIWRAQANEVRNYSYNTLDNKISICQSILRPNEGPDDKEIKGEPETGSSSDLNIGLQDNPLLRSCLLSYDSSEIGAGLWMERGGPLPYRKDDSLSLRNKRLDGDRTDDVITIDEDEVIVINDDHSNDTVPSHRKNENRLLKKILQTDKDKFEIYGDLTNSKTSLGKLDKICRELSFTNNAAAVAIKDLKHNEIHIYINNVCLKIIDNIVDIEVLLKEQFGHTHIKFLCLNVCCWAFHTTVLTKISSYYSTKLIKPNHRCRRGKCDCCCDIETFRFEKDCDDFKLDNIQCQFSKDQECNITTLSKEKINIISMALNYKPNIKYTPPIKATFNNFSSQFNTDANKSNLNYTPSTKATFKDFSSQFESDAKIVDIETFLKDNKKMIIKEWYIIDTKGEICNLRVTKIATTGYCQPFCCSNTRKEHIRKLTYIEPHTKSFLLGLDMFSEHCNECTINKTQTSVSRPFSKIMETKTSILQHSSGVFNTHINRSVIESHHDIRNLPLDTNISPKETSPSELGQTTSSNSGVDPRYILNKNVLNNHIVANNFRLDTNVILESSQEAEINQMISTLLYRFKNVQLTLNEDGKVAATIQTPLSTLTSSELTILRNILEHAQNHVQAMNLNNKNSTNITSTNFPITTDDLENVPTVDLTDELQQPNEKENITQISGLESNSIYDNFECWLIKNNNSYKKSFLSYVQYSENDRPSEIDITRDDESSTPQIGKVFSLKQFMYRKNDQKQKQQTVPAIDMDEAIAHTKIVKKSEAPTGTPVTTGIPNKRKIPLNPSPKWRRVKQKKNEEVQTYIILNPSPLFALQPNTFQTVNVQEMLKNNSDTVASNGSWQPYSIVNSLPPPPALIPIQSAMPVIQTVSSLHQPQNILEEENNVTPENDVEFEEVKVEPMEHINFDS
ncbi:uncharacterized protein LOC126970965 isoform X2 [Leptidea sinapis]|uniref:uncharacterized protein LOC126970965 isoform X2 n=1 Tax=Leptidea sinapis TaxID=189913 RepID=UPI00212EDC39|nr:uncharacterized protein LOC126970965 isoform X2 [Leptidea sinapis]